MSNSSRPFLGAPTTFAKAYPQVKEVLIKGERSGDLQSEMQKTLGYRGLDPPTTFACGNHRCQQGGFPIEQIVRYMVDQRQTQYETTMHCSGHEGSPNGRRRGDPCSNYAKLTISIAYSNKTA